MTSDIVLKQYSSDFENQWLIFLSSNENSTFYHRIEWKDIIESCFNHKSYYLIALENDKIRGLLPLIYIKSLIFGSMLTSMPFLNYGGVLSDQTEIIKLLLSEATKLQQKIKTNYIELRHLNKTQFDLPFKSHKVSMVVELDKDPEKLWNEFSSKHRTNIRKSIKQDFKFEIGGLDVLDEFYQVISEGWRKLGTPIYKKSFFKKVLTSFKKDVEICAVRYEDDLIAVAFNGLFNDTIEGMWTHSLFEYKKLNVNYFLYWKMIENACERGFNKFNLGRSTADSSAIQFKKKWNAKPTQLYWEYILNNNQSMPELNVDNPKYQKYINIWKHLPLKATQILGPIFAKNIP